MIGYVTLGSLDPEKAAAFYDPLLAELGARRLWQFDRGIAWGTAPDQPSLGLLKPFDGQDPSVGNGTMVALKAADRDTVAKVHAKALELGAQNEGDVGPRGEGFYGGYFRDPHGHKLCVYCVG